MNSSNFIRSVDPVCSKLDRILRYSKSAKTKITLVNVSDFPAQLVCICFNNILSDHVDVQDQYAIDKTFKRQILRRARWKRTTDVSEWISR